MKKLSILIMLALLIGVVSAQAQKNKKYSVYAVGFYNLENLP